ncbi:hypothetical protein K435DRAFT_853434 [Dendrothele bispora CBS 962.96]|uniref:Uncharacterized protein n=1 Tax=Dendrothele bispora (strain CBS 962.96) TaxID=1314807 RepID=A0A4S8MGV3_DENBC|nr:hypothetical protein K435DRAFT_853434 [Dendrothele bispora CBS 962.96]
MSAIGTLRGKRSPVFTLRVRFQHDTEKKGWVRLAGIGSSLWTKQFIVDEVGDTQFEVLHRQGIKKQGRGLPVMQYRGKLEEDFVDYWWKNQHIWKFSREAFGRSARNLIPSVTQYWVLDLERRLDWLWEKRLPLWYILFSLSPNHASVPLFTESALSKRSRTGQPPICVDVV